MVVDPSSKNAKGWFELAATRQFRFRIFEGAHSQVAQSQLSKSLVQWLGQPSQSPYGRPSGRLLSGTQRGMPGGGSLSTSSQLVRGCATFIQTWHKSSAGCASKVTRMTPSSSSAAPRSSTSSRHLSPSAYRTGAGQSLWSRISSTPTHWRPSPWWILLQSCAFRDLGHDLGILSVIPHGR